MIREKLKLTNLLELLIKVSLGRESMVKVTCLVFTRIFITREEMLQCVLLENALHWKCGAKETERYQETGHEMANKPRCFSHSRKRWGKKVRVQLISVYDRHSKPLFDLCKVACRIPPSLAKKKIVFFQPQLVRLQLGLGSLVASC